MANFNTSILLDVKTTASERKVKRLERGIAKVENATRDILSVDKQIVRERRALLRLSGEQAAKSKRRSPSRFIRNLFGQARKQIEAQVDAAIAAGLWDCGKHSTVHLGQPPPPQVALDHQGRRDGL